MTDTVPPLTDDIPTLSTRARSKISAFWDIPVVVFLEYSLPIAMIAAAIYWVIANGWEL